MFHKRILFLIPVLLLSGFIQADEVRPAYLELQEVSTNNFNVLWKRPVNKTTPIHLKLEFPDGCDIVGESTEWEEDDFRSSRMTISCSDGLTEKNITLAGLESSLTDALLRIEFVNGRTLVERLTPGRNNILVSKQPSIVSIINSYFFLGMEHILSGVDHLLFVLCIMLLLTDKKKLLMAVTAFTVAHSITLVAATLGYVQVNAKVVEVLIALSIVLISYEIIRARLGVLGLSTRYPWLVIFIFGLMHGLGFAGALSHIGLPENDIPLALLFFNIGVEAGQLLFIAMILLLLWPMKHWFNRSSLNWVSLISYVIGISASYWFFERLSVLTA